MPTGTLPACCIFLTRHTLCTIMITKRSPPKKLKVQRPWQLEAGNIRFLARRADTTRTKQLTVKAAIDFK
eukprot:681447-Amphidinium_carterae.2